MSRRTHGVLDQCAGVQGHTKTTCRRVPAQIISCSYAYSHSTTHLCPLISPSSPPPPCTLPHLHTPSPAHPLPCTLPHSLTCTLPPLHTPSPPHSLTSHRTSGRAIIVEPNTNPPWTWSRTGLTCSCPHRTGTTGYMQTFGAELVGLAEHVWSWHQRTGASLFPATIGMDSLDTELQELQVSFNYWLNCW